MYGKNVQDWRVKWGTVAAGMKETYSFYFLFFPPALLRYNWQINIINIEGVHVLFWYMCTCEMITVVKLINSSTTSYSYVFCCVCVLRTHKYSLSNFPVYSTVWLTIVALLDIDLQNLFILHNQNFVLFAQCHSISLSPRPLATTIPLWYYELDFFGFCT